MACDPWQYDEWWREMVRREGLTSKNIPVQYSPDSELVDAGRLDAVLAEVVPREHRRRRTPKMGDALPTTAGSSRSELSGLRQQLQVERLARLRAEGEILRMRAEVSRSVTPRQMTPRRMTPRASTPRSSRGSGVTVSASHASWPSRGTEWASTISRLGKPPEYRR
mmetsp:Transcript_83975/g.191569  ORF Transcript_83975/g.191569 Transcript_83975/m.191569 type:complete len:166 (+) Transcript_83975:30-527(+)